MCDRFLSGRLVVHPCGCQDRVLPTKNEGVNLKSNSATDARNDKMIARLVAKPFEIVVRVFDDDRSDQTSEGLNDDRAPGPSKFLSKSSKPCEFL